MNEKVKHDDAVAQVGAPAPVRWCTYQYGILQAQQLLNVAQLRVKVVHKVFKSGMVFRCMRLKKLQSRMYCSSLWLFL